MQTMKWFKTIMVTAATAFAVGAFAQPADDGVVVLKNPQSVENDGKVEVLEFFGYGCIHCAHLEPKFEEWIKRQPADVKVKRVPVPFESRGIDSIPIFYTLEAMGLLEKLHQKVFDAANVENVALANPAVLNKWLEKQGVNPAQYEEVKKSFSVGGKINRARRLAGDYQIMATPTLVINGRTLVSQTSGPERMFAKADQLIAEARASLKSTAAPAKADPKAEPAKAETAKPAKAKKVSRATHKAKSAQTAQPA
jgi:protein dithiol oxidoreductase (disulfide-forming)